MNKLYFYGKVMTLLLAGKLVPSHVIREDYDRLSVSYDRYFAERMAKHAQRLVDQLGVRPGDRALDLATGTGNLALALTKAVGPREETIGVDQSAGMLAKAEERRHQAGDPPLRFIQGDMRTVLLSYPDCSLDIITCGWAIGYDNPPQLIKIIRRKLRPGGKLGLIENARDTLAPIHAASLKVAQTLPQHMRQIMDLHRHLPRHCRQLEAWFESADLRTLSLWEGWEEFSFTSGAEVLDWIMHTGASAGFDRMMAAESKARCDELFIQHMEMAASPPGHIVAAHHYVAGIAQKETLSCT